MLRQARLDAPGTLPHVIIRGIERRAIVADEADRRAFVECLGRLASELKTDIYAMALLTNHAHLLLGLAPVRLPTFMRRFLTDYALNRTTQHSYTTHPVTPFRVILNVVKNLTVETLRCAQGDRAGVPISCGLI